MRIPIRSRQLIVAGSWFATAVIAYSVGSMGSSQPPKSAAASGSNSGGGLTPNAGAATFSLLPGTGSGDAQRDGKVPTTAQITGGMPTAEFLKQLLAQDDEATRMSGFLRLLETLTTAEDIENALKVVAESGGRNRGPMRVSREYSLLLERYTKLDAKAAAAYASDPKRSNEERWMGTGTVLKTWTRTDPEAAIAWAQANGVPPADANNQRGPSQGGPGQDGNWALASVVAQLARTDINRALQVAGNEELSRSRGRMMGTLITELIGQRDESAARDAILALPAGSFRDGMTAQLAGRLADQDGPRTMEWVKALAPGDGKTRALAETVDEWSKKDPAAVGKFLTSYPLGAESDPMREEFAKSIVKADPSGAAAWALSITTPEIRDRTTQNIVRDWMRRDQAAAQTWVASAQISDEVKARLNATPQGIPDGQRARRGPQN